MHVKRVGWTKLVNKDKYIHSSKYESSAVKGEGTAGIVEENVVFILYKVEPLTMLQILLCCIKFENVTNKYCYI